MIILCVFIPYFALQCKDALPDAPDIKRKLSLVKAYEQCLPQNRMTGSSTVSISYIGAIPRIQINGEILFPMAMLPSPRVKFDEAKLSCQDFAAAGVRIFSNILWNTNRYGNWWLDEGKYDFRIVDEMVESILSIHPDALFFPRIKLDPQPWWIKRNPEEMRVRRDGQKTSLVSMASDKWRRSYEEMLKALIAHMESAPYHAHIIGYHLAAGHGGEWLYPGGGDGQGDISRPAREGFREFLRKRLNNNQKALAELTEQYNLTFDTVEVPTDFRYGGDICRDPAAREDALILEYHRFLIAGVNDNLLNAARLTKKLTGGKKLVGVFYGYCLRAAGVKGGRFYPVLKSKYVDFIATPAVYSSRNTGDAGAFQNPATASIRLHKKLYFDEADVRTCYYLKDPNLAYRAKHLRDSMELMKRHFGYALTQDCGLWWFLLAGNETFHDENLMRLVKKMEQIGRESLTEEKHLPAEIAVFISEEGRLFSAEFPFSQGALRANMFEEILPRLGTTVDQYVLEDLAHPDLPDYKVYIFLNAFKMNSEIRKAIREKVMKRGKAAIWFYAPDYVHDDGLKPDAVSRITGMNLKRKISSRLQRITPTGGGRAYAFRTTFEVADPDAEILAEVNGRPVLARKIIDGYTSIYSMLSLNTNELRRLLRECGVHIYTSGGDVFSGNDRYLMLHASSSGLKSIRLPGAYRVREIFRDNVFSGPKTRIDETFTFGETRIYQIKK